MKIEQIPMPNTATSLPGAKTEAQMTAREKAIQALMKPAAHTAPVPDPTRISPEEHGAVYTQRKAAPQPPAQNDNTESSAPTPEAETKVSSEPLSSQYATLARKEKALRLQQQQMKARELALKAQEDALKAPAKPSFDESKYVPRDRLTQDPFTVLNELGLTYDQLTEMALNAPKPEQMAIMNEMKALKSEIAALKGEQEKSSKSFEEKEKLQYTQAMNQIRNEVNHLVSVDPQFETIQATGSVGDVVELIERTFNEDGVLMSVEDAASQVEDYLVEAAMKLSRIKKIQQRLAPKAAPAQKNTTQSQQPQLKTLTNSVSSSRQLSAKERALLAFEGKLNK